MDYSPIVQRINDLIIDAGLKKGAFWSAIGVSPQLQSLWKTDQSTPQIPTLEKIADFFGVSLKWLMFGDDDDIKNAPAVSGEGDDLCKLSADEWELIAAYRDLNDEGQADARKQLFVMQQSGIYKKHHSSAMVSKNA